jgi:hypothetical protein
MSPAAVVPEDATYRQILEATLAVLEAFEQRDHRRP